MVPDELRTFPFGDGHVVMGDDGSVVAVGHPVRDHSMLLEESPDAPEAAFHRPVHRWGKGFVVTDRVSHRWDRPDQVRWWPDGLTVRYLMGDLTLVVRRQVRRQWRETYSLRNVSASTVTIGSLGVSTPWRDVYGSGLDSLRRGVHAHVWTGGADSWVWAVPMDGSGPGLGLVLESGELWAYSIASRDPMTGSNARGHIYLHLTDNARAPHAMGGQPLLTLDPGEVVSWEWRCDWYPDLAALHATRSPSVTATALAAEVGTPIRLTTAEGTTLDEPAPVIRDEPGVVEVDAEHDGRRSRVSLLFHLPLRELVEARIRFVLDRQRPHEQPGSYAAAFVPYDNGSGLTELPSGWPDWNDTRERVGTALMLQEARVQGWGDPAELAAALDAYEGFVLDHVVSPDGTVADDTRTPGPMRFYNYPWFVRFFLGQGDLDRAVSIMDRYYALGGEHYVAFELGPLLRTLSTRLDAEGRPADARRMLDHLLRHARAVLDHDDDLPAHEVNYEQSMVAPMVELLLAAYLTDRETVPVAQLQRRMAWLTAFAADQPDVRLRHVPIRHWDGYWFGRLKLWGDVFPHYWSVLSAAVYLTWPDGLAEPARLAELRSAGHAILRSNLTAFAADGSATCAFVYPSCVDGRPAHVADPMANDQDWALVYAMRYGLGG